MGSTGKKVSRGMTAPMAPPSTTASTLSSAESGGVGVGKGAGGRLRGGGAGERILLWSGATKGQGPGRGADLARPATLPHPGAYPHGPPASGRARGARPRTRGRAAVGGAKQKKRRRAALENALAEGGRRRAAEVGRRPAQAQAAHARVWRSGASTRTRAAEGAGCRWGVFARRSPPPPLLFSPPARSLALPPLFFLSPSPVLASSARACVARRRAVRSVEAGPSLVRPAMMDARREVCGGGGGGRASVQRAGGGGVGIFDSGGRRSRFPPARKKGRARVQPPARTRALLAHPCVSAHTPSLSARGARLRVGGARVAPARPHRPPPFFLTCADTFSAELTSFATASRESSSLRLVPFRSAESPDIVGRGACVRAGGAGGWVCAGVSASKQRSAH
jgi:hypothetical protein